MATLSKQPNKKQELDKKGREFLEGLHPLERAVLPHLTKEATLQELVTATGLQEVEVMRALQWLSNKEILTISTEQEEEIVLDSNGLDFLQRGLPERRFLESISEHPLSLKEIEQQGGLEQGEGTVCIGILKKKQAIEIKENQQCSITNEGKKILKAGYPEEQTLKKIAEGRAARSDVEYFLKRKKIIRIQEKKKKSIALTQKGEWAASLPLQQYTILDQLTPAILQKKAWKDTSFRRYDIKSNVPPIFGGKRHFVNQAIDYIKRIWLDLGFTEMQGNMVQTAFWDLDALFVPQDHSARAMQDTFFVGEKDFTYGDLPAAYRDIKAAHEHGGTTGSTGWKTPWKEEEARKVLLRTHTTVLSAIKLAELQDRDIPGKFFSVGKVFRNEALDWKHLFEFFQVDGIVVDPDANLKHLKGYLRTFFGKMGYPKVRMRPAYFPYTEPSMEIEVFHPQRKEWIELGGSGIFRPEFVKTLTGKDIPVLAWGLGLERIISEYHQIESLRDIYKNDIQQLKESKLLLK